MNDIAVSTVWNAINNDNAENIITQIKALGVDAIELNFTLSQTLLDQMYEQVKKHALQVVSVHNYCPLPKEYPVGEKSPDAFSIASTSEEQRLKAVYHTKRTIDTAVRFNAKNVIVHAGRVEIECEMKALLQYYREGKNNSDDFIAIRRQLVQKREKYQQGHIQQAIKSLNEIVAYAEQQNVNLALENRFYYREIPSLEEMGVLFEAVKGPLYFWYDLGHALVQERLGFVQTKDFIEKYKTRMVGMHIHNVLGVKDHLGILQGEENLQDIISLCPQDIVKVLECHNNVTAEQMKDSIQYLTNC